MRKVLCLALAVLLITSVAFAQSYRENVRGYKESPGVGEIQSVGAGIAQPYKTFRLVRWIYPSTPIADYTASADWVVIWATGLSGDDGVTVTTTTTTFDTRIAGVLKADVQRISTDTGKYATEDIGDNNWTWMQTHGLCSVDATGQFVAGSILGTSGIAGDAGSPNVGLTADTQLKAGPGGFFYNDQTDTSDGVKCFLRLE